MCKILIMWVGLSQVTCNDGMILTLYLVFLYFFLCIKKNAAHQEALKREIERLRQVYHQQNLKKMENVAQSPTTPSDTPEKEQLLNVSS